MVTPWPPYLTAFVKPGIVQYVEASRLPLGFPHGIREVRPAGEEFQELEVLHRLEAYIGVYTRISAGRYLSGHPTESLVAMLDQ